MSIFDEPMSGVAKTILAGGVVATFTSLLILVACRREILDYCKTLILGQSSNA